MTKKLTSPVDNMLRAALRNRPLIIKRRKDGKIQHGQASLRAIGKETGVAFTTLSNYANDGVSGYIQDGDSETLEVLHRSHLTLAQADRLAQYLGLEIELTKLKPAK